MAFVIAPVVIAGYLAGLPFGISGIAAGYSIAMLILVVPMIAWAIHASAISWREISNAILPPLVSATASTALTYVVISAATSWQPLQRVIIGTGILIPSYLVILLFGMGQKQFYLGVARDSLRAVRGQAQVAAH
jgi:PST family polysaccharide transporter